LTRSRVVGRYGLVVVIAWIGALKFTAYEAQGIQPLVANSPFMSWLYDIFPVNTFSAMLGVVEITTAVLLAINPRFPRLSVLGSVLATGLFLATITFLFTTPGVGEASAGGFPVLSSTGQFLIKVRCLAGIVTLDTGRLSPRGSAAFRRIGGRHSSSPPMVDSPTGTERPHPAFAGVGPFR
jgi:reactive chlorine resistance protein C